MRWRATIAAGLVFIALLAWVLTQEKGRVPEEDEVFGIDVETVTAMRVEREGEEPLAVERRGDSWHIVEPFTGLANTDEVERIIKAVAELTPKTSREGADLSSDDFGLADPYVRATLTCAGGRTATVVVGSETAMGSDRYAKVQGARDSSDNQRLHVVPAMLRTTLSKDAEELREKQLASYETEQVQRVTLTHDDFSIVAVRGGDGEDEPAWLLKSPLEAPADEYNVKHLLNNLKDLRAEDFLTEDASDEQLGFADPQARIDLALAGDEQLTVTFGNTAERTIDDEAASATHTDEDEPTQIVYVRTSERSEVLMVKAEELDKFRKNPFELRDKTVVSFERNDVERVRVDRRKGLSFTVASRPEGWRVEKPRHFDADQSAIDDILWDLEDLSATAFVAEQADEATLREYGLVVPQTVISIHIKGQDEPVRVLVGDQTDEGEYYCTTSETERVVTISEFLMSDLPESVEDLESEAEGISGDDDAGAAELPPDNEIPMPTGD